MSCVDSLAIVEEPQQRRNHREPPPPSRLGRRRNGRFAPGNAAAAAAGRPRKNPPPECILTTGWRSELVRMLEEYGLVSVQDTIAAYAEFRVRQERLEELYDTLAIGSEALELLNSQYPATRRIRAAWPTSHCRE